MRKKAKGILWRELSLLWISVTGYIYLSNDSLYKIVLGSLEREPHGVKISIGQAEVGKACKELTGEMGAVGIIQYTLWQGVVVLNVEQGSHKIPYMH